MAIRIGTHGELPPSELEVELLGGFAGVACAWCEPFPGLPCALFGPPLWPGPSPPVADPPPCPECSSVGDPPFTVFEPFDPPSPPVVPPFVWEALAGGSEWWESWPPVAVGGASVYWISVASVAWA
jgi:hypothetical protein